jgi:hypothetical protein
LIAPFVVRIVYHRRRESLGCYLSGLRRIELEVQRLNGTLVADSWGVVVVGYRTALASGHRLFCHF